MAKIVPAKIGFFGGSGSGKTTTAALLAVATSVELHNRAPVWVNDTEPGWQFTRRIFATEGVELVQKTGRSFTKMEEHLRDAERAGACVYAVDSMTHTWAELMDTFAGTNGRVQFQQFNLIKRNWNRWTINFLNSPMHCYALGRLGYDYDSQTDEKTGKKEIVKGDSKFKAGGGESFGYEPHLLLEMELEREGTSNGRGGKLVHIANVLKDRARILNGETFEFHDIKGYKKGDYRKVWEALLPHIEELQLLGDLTVLNGGNSSELLPESENSWYRTQQAKKVALETIEVTMGTKLWPGSTAEAKKIKLTVLEKVFGTRAWAAVEDMSLTKLEAGVNALRGYEQFISGGKVPSTEAEVLAALEESRTAPQPIVAAIDDNSPLEGVADVF